ncbi:hypothetical protein ACAG39_10685 [Caldicellulosiruptoraceae bacterium PP1]
MLDRVSFTRQVVILKGIETRKDLIPNGYIKLQKIGNILEFDLVLQSVFVDEEKLNFYAIIKQSSYLPIYLTSLPKPKKGKLEHYLSTNCSNVFTTGIPFNEIIGFLVAKEKKDKIDCLLIGELDGNNLFNIEKDILSYFNKAHEKKNEEKKIGFKVEDIKLSNIDIADYEKSEKQEGKDEIKLIDEDNLKIEGNYDVNADKENSIIQIDNSNLDFNKDIDEQIIEVNKTNEDDKKDEIENREEIENRFNVLEFGNKEVWRRIFNELKEIGEKHKPFSGDKVKWVKIDKKDVYKVSQYHPFLYMLSSPFVLKLIGNYGYIIIGLRSSKRNDKIEILLPGEFSEEDQNNARVFGFSEFITKDNKIYEGKDGYWRMSIELIQGEV